MNTAILIPTLKQGGAEKQAALLAATLTKHHHVDIFLLYGIDSIAPQNKKIIDQANVTIHSLSGGMISKLFRLKREFKTRKIDIIFNYLTSCNVVGAIAGRMAGVRRIYGGIRNTSLEWHKHIADMLTHNLISTGTIYNCHSGLTHFTSKGFRKRNNIVIPNGFIDIAEPIVRKDRDIKHIVTAGRFVPQKDYKTLIRTIAHLKTLRNDFVMDIIGYGEEEQNIRLWVNEFGVEQNVNIYIKPDNVQDIIRNADIYLSTSLFEGTSNSIMEAMNWSLPIVATNVGDNDHLIVEGVNGMLHPIGDYIGMAHSIATLLSRSEIRNQYGKCSNDTLRSKYSMEVFETRYLELIKQ